jgi:hypothetical protein
MYFPNAFKKVFLPSSGTPVASGVGTNDSTMIGTAASPVTGKLGFFAPTSSTNSTLTSLDAGGGNSKYSVKPFYLIQSSYFSTDKIGSNGGYKESIKSKLINPKYISRVIKVTAKSAVNQVVKVNANAFVAVNQTYRLRLDVKGSPALRYLNHQLYRTLDAYSGVVGATAANVWRDPASVLLLWKEQLNGNPILSQFVQARVYKYAAGQSATSAVTATTTQTTIPMTTTTGILVGQKAVGTGIPANSFVTTVTASTSIVIKYPTQAAAPTIASNVAVKFFTDLYTANEVAVFTAIGANAYQNIYIPGTSTASGLAANPTAYDATASDASSQTAATAGQESHIEFTAAYVDTVFGNATFTPTDKYDLEPLYVYAAVTDELGNTNLSTSFAANSSTISASVPYLSSHGIEIQAPAQAQGYGETVLRDLILSGRYAQNAYPDSKFVDDFRQREIEADPMLAAVTRSSLYDQYLILHNVPRWNNPASMFDNDQYLISIYVPAGTSVSNVTDFVIYSANIAQAGSATAGLIALETY